MRCWRHPVSGCLRAPVKMMSSPPPLVSNHCQPRSQLTVSRAEGWRGRKIRLAAERDLPAHLLIRLGMTEGKVAAGAPKPPAAAWQSDTLMADHCGQCRIFQGRIFPRTRSSGDLSLRESESEQARAKQCQAGRRQSQEAVGDKVMIAHDSPSEVDARSN